MLDDVDIPDSGREQKDSKGGLARNIIIVGVMASGKSSVGWRLARLIGFGIIDVDEWIQKRAGKPIERIFAEEGESAFRQQETAAIQEIAKIRNHVVSVGGGAVLDDTNWEILRGMGATVWLNTPPSEVARRLVMKPDEIRRRPLLADVVNIEDKQQRFRALHDRVEALVGQRRQRYGQARLVMEDAYSTPEAAALRLKELLIESGILRR